MIIGDRGRFAIEFQVDEPRLEHWLFGKLCYRVGGQEVGDYDLGGTLNGAVGAFIRLLEFKGSRQEPTLMSSPAADVFNRIDGALYIDSGQSDLQVRTDWESFKRFHAWPVGFDVFDDWKCYLIEDDKIGRFLWKDCRPGGDRSFRKRFYRRASSILSFFLLFNTCNRLIQNVVAARKSEDLSGAVVRLEGLVGVPDAPGPLLALSASPGRAFASG